MKDKRTFHLSIAFMFMLLIVKVMISPYLYNT